MGGHGAQAVLSISCATSRVMSLVLLTLATLASAHHSFAVFFNTEDQVHTITGIVKDFQFRNPHGEITVVVAKGRSNIVWRAETNSPSILRRRGWSAESLHVGDSVTLEGWLARDGTNYMRMRSARLADGRLIGQPLGER
jgi:hypothetical protein